MLSEVFPTRGSSTGSTERRREMMRSSPCGHDNRPDLRFCTQCGAPLAARCASCGAQRRADARDLLAPVYGWFTEGFATRDLIDAKALLDELR